MTRAEKRRQARVARDQLRAFNRLLPPQPKLTGLCNRCGLCCTAGNLRCEYLQISKDIGTESATRCTRYETRYEGMPIEMVDMETGEFGRMSACGGKEMTRAEAFFIVQRGMGNGCSYRKEEENAV